MPERAPPVSGQRRGYISLNQQTAIGESEPSTRNGRQGEFTGRSFSRNAAVTFVCLFSRRSFRAVLVMQTPFNSGTRSFASLLHALACLFSLVMLVSFPITKAHHFETHFRNPEVRRPVLRHTSMSQPEDNRPERVVRYDIRPTPLIPVDSASNLKPLAKFAAAVSRTPLRRRLLRLKLGPSRASGQTPDLILKIRS